MPPTVLANLPDRALADLFAEACLRLGFDFASYEEWFLVEADLRTKPCACVVASLDLAGPEALPRFNATVSIHLVPIVLCVDRARVSLRGVQEATEMGLKQLFEVGESPTVNAAATALNDAFQARPGVLLAGLLRGALELEVGGLPERAVRELAEAQGRIRSGKQLARGLGFEDPRTLSALLRRAGLFDAGSLTDWVNVLFYATTMRWYKLAASGLARVAGDSPSALYRRVRTLTDVGIQELANEDFLKLLGRFQRAREAHLGIRLIGEPPGRDGARKNDGGPSATSPQAYRKPASRRNARKAVRRS